MVLILVAELLGGETRVSPGGPVDTATAAADEVALWSTTAREAAAPPVEVETEITGVRVGATPARA